MSAWRLLPGVLLGTRTVCGRLLLRQRRLHPVPGPVLLPCRGCERHGVSKRRGVPLRILGPGHVPRWNLLPQWRGDHLPVWQFLRAGGLDVCDLPPESLLSCGSHRGHCVPGQQQHRGHGRHGVEPVPVRPGVCQLRFAVRAVRGQLLLRGWSPDDRLPHWPVLAARSLQRLAMPVPRAGDARRLLVRVRRGPAAGHERRGPVRRVGMRRLPGGQRVYQRGGVHLPQRQRVRVRHRQPVPEQQLLRGGRANAVPGQRVLGRRLRLLHLQ